MRRCKISKSSLFLIIFGIIIFGLRLFNINEAIYDDESNFAYSLTVMDKFGFNEEYYSPMPLNLIYKPFIALFGLETWVFRIVPWLFGIINTIFVYVFARRNFGRKAAFWSTFLMLVSFYPTLASLQLDVEGNLVMFCAVLMLFSYLEYERALETGNKRKQLGWQILSGVGLGVAVISKYNAVYLVLVLLIYSLIRRKGNVKRSFQDLFMIGVVGILIFLSYILLTMIASPHNWADFVEIGVITTTAFGSRFHNSNFSFLGLSMYVLWSTILLFGFYVISLFKRIKENLLLLLWISIFILFYTFFVTYGSFDRYFMNTIPALTILGGIFLSKVKLRKNDLILGYIVVTIFTTFLFLINSFPIKYVARFPELYLNELKSLNLNFLFVYTSASGPTFGVNFATIFWSFFISVICLFFYLFLSRKKALSRFFFVLFFSIALAFNVFLVSEYLFHPIGADVSDVKWQMIDYVKYNNLSFPIYTNDQGIQWYFEHDYLWQNKITQGFGDNEIGSNTFFVKDRIKKEGGTILLLHWPPLPDESPAWEIVEQCRLSQSFYSKEILIGEAYDCRKN